MKILTAIVFTLLLPCSAFAEETKAPLSFEEKAIDAALLYCLPALTVGDSVIRVAEMDKLPEMPPLAQKAFLKGKPGKVFALPKVGNDALLLAYEAPLCSVVIRKMDVPEFKKQVDHWFANPPSPFELIKDDSSIQEISRQYQGKVGKGKTNILILVSARYQTSGNLQGMITVGRTTGQP